MSYEQVDPKPLRPTKWATTLSPPSCDTAIVASKPPSGPWSIYLCTQSGIQVLTAEADEISCCSAFFTFYEDKVIVSVIDLVRNHAACFTMTLTVKTIDPTARKAK